MLPPGLRALLEALDAFTEKARATAAVRAALARRAGPLRTSFLSPLLEELAAIEEEFTRAALKVNEAVRRALGK